MTAPRTILITGATGKQGGAVLRELVGQGFSLHAMTRKPDSDAAREIAALGATVVGGDLDDVASLARALAGVWGVFAVQNTWEAGVVLEEEQGKRMAEVARKAGVTHFVYSSVDSANRNTGIPHFDNKGRIEDEVRAAGFPSWVILRPVFFMENLPTPSFLRGDSIVTSLDPATTLQMIAVEDIGRFGARVFVDAARFNGRAIELAGDGATMPEAAAVFSAALGRTISFVQIPVAEIRKNSEDYALMLEWFDAVGFNADIPALKAEFGFTPLTLREWAARLTP